MVAAGRRWPTPLLEQAWALRHPAAPLWLALALVLLPPLLIGLVLVVGRHQPRPPDGAPHPDRGESSD
jgi:hypothetical protein